MGSSGQIRAFCSQKFVFFFLIFFLSFICQFCRLFIKSLDRFGSNLAAFYHFFMALKKITKFGTLFQLILLLTSLNLHLFKDFTHVQCCQFKHEDVILTNVLPQFFGLIREQPSIRTIYYILTKKCSQISGQVSYQKFIIKMDKNGFHFLQKIYKKTKLTFKRLINQRIYLACTFLQF